MSIRTLYLFIYTVPASPRSCYVTLLYSQSSRRLEFIDIAWNWMPVSHMIGYAIILFLSKRCTYNYHC